MKKVQIRQDFDVPLETLLRARQERYNRLDKFPELKNVHIEEEKREGNVLKQVRHIAIGDSMPSVVATLLPAGADTLVETSTFEESTHVHDFVVIPGGNLEHIFKIEGISRYFETSPGKSARDYEISIKSGAFLVSGLVEAAIADIYTNNLEKDRKSIAHFIEILAEEAGEAEPSSGSEV